MSSHNWTEQVTVTHHLIKHPTVQPKLWKVCLHYWKRIKQSILIYFSFKRKTNFFNKISKPSNLISRNWNESLRIISSHQMYPETMTHIHSSHWIKVLLAISLINLEENRTRMLMQKNNLLRIIWFLPLL